MLMPHLPTFQIVCLEYQKPSNATDLWLPQVAEDRPQLRLLARSSAAEDKDSLTALWSAKMLDKARKHQSWKRKPNYCVNAWQSAPLPWQYNDIKDTSVGTLVTYM